MTPALKVLVRFRRKLDNEILNQKSVFHFNFMLDNYAKGNINDEDLAEVKGYYSGLKVAREMLQRIIEEQKEIEGYCDDFGG